VIGSKRTSRYLPRRPTSSSGKPYALSGAGTAVFSAVKVIGTNRFSRWPAKSAVSRSAWAWTSGISGTTAPQAYSVRSRTSLNTASSAPNTGCASSNRCWSP
jgi:hypothetical protein